jgi:hypothetical protein
MRKYRHFWGILDFLALIMILAKLLVKDENKLQK